MEKTGSVPPEKWKEAFGVRLRKKDLAWLSGVYASGAVHVYEKPLRMECTEEVFEELFDVLKRYYGKFNKNIECYFKK